MSGTLPIQRYAVVFQAADLPITDTPAAAQAIADSLARATAPPGAFAVVPVLYLAPCVYDGDAAFPVDPAVADLAVAVKDASDARELRKPGEMAEAVFNPDGQIAP